MKRTKFNLSKSKTYKGKYEPWMAHVARKMVGFLGARNKDLAAVFGVSIKTIEHWIKVKPKFRAAVHVGRLEVSTAVAQALVKRALGFKHKETKVFCTRDGEIVTRDIMKYFPPDANAAFKYLTIMMREVWSEKTNIEINSTVTHRKIEDIPLEELSSKEQDVIFSLAKKQLEIPSKN